MMGQKWGSCCFISTPSGSSPHIMYWFFFLKQPTGQAAQTDKAQRQRVCLCWGGITDLGGAWQVYVSQTGGLRIRLQALCLCRVCMCESVVCLRECNGCRGVEGCVLGPAASSTSSTFVFTEVELLRESLQILTVKASFTLYILKYCFFVCYYC